MKIIHTSDWHLGSSLGESSRIYEHAKFLEFLTETVRKEQADALIVAGDIYDSANPSTDCQHMFFSFLARLVQTFPKLNVIITSGNHDSPSRLGIGREMAEFLNIHIVTRIELKEDRTPDLERLIFPLKDADGNIRAYCAAVPFIRRADLPVSYGQNEHYHEDSFVNALYTLHRDLQALMKQRTVNGEKLIVVDHTTVHGIQGVSVVQEESEHPILIGNVESIPADIFDGFDYAALGHIHLRSILGNKTPVVYSGSVIPMSFSEKHYSHGVELVSVDSENKLTFTQVKIPRAVEVLTIPKEFKPLEEVLQDLEALPVTGLKPEEYPFVEVQYQTEGADARVAGRIREALTGKEVRLIKITKSLKSGANATVEETESRNKDLVDMDPLNVFKLFYRSTYASNEAPDSLCKEFEKALDEVRQKEE